MARTLLVATANGPNGGGVNNITFTAATTALGHYFVNTGHERLLARNLDAAAKTVTIKSVDDIYGRSEDIVLTVPAAVAGVPGLAFAGPFNPGLFNQTASADLGKVFVETSADTALALAVVSDP